MFIIRIAYFLKLGFPDKTYQGPSGFFKEGTNRLYLLTIMVQLGVHPPLDFFVIASPFR